MLRDLFWDSDIYSKRNIHSIKFMLVNAAEGGRSATEIKLIWENFLTWWNPFYNISSAS